MLRVDERRSTVLAGRWLSAIGLSLVAVGVLAACGSSSKSSTAPPSTSTATTAKTWSIVALGDSVPHGTNCNCTPYPPLTASGLASGTGQKVTASNDSVPGYTTSDVRHQLNADSNVIDHVRAADTIEIEIGANDVGYTDSCGTTVACYTPKVPTIEKNLNAIVSRVHELTSGHKVLVVLLDYWSVWLGGQYAAAKGNAYVNAAAEMTDQVDTVIKSTATKTKSAYVDLRAAFKGPNYSYDETHYLSGDGDHPNAAGHQQIAAAIATDVRKALGI